MPNITMYIKGTTEQVMDALASAAKKEGFVVEDEKGTKMTVRKGSLAMSILLGIFVVYVKGDAKVKDEGEGEVKLTLDWNGPWWQGIFGPMRAKGAMKGYATRVERAVEDEGGEVLERKDK